ncbi:MAG: hypothetical protein COU90_00040 [Candidatus Ryanbacteria bacterium CG10_big_fil_rev_8_21_14_0_10_43_42]|uniref:POTRA domain-containing protein n=1 Tax=Candidatus Ryanbacteria bacterium CG10_big_fil_rev_8_21_14_0_10_43_42 TaxID=1974864 RepID=A0A2M8KY98_9BACT|nr:MAG: hypothetical protein COU90_00040 [Candidatus Ryanbacteria bacterium CG10_big_fil_rev_8_21_14_0_10_43_42]
MLGKNKTVKKGSILAKNRSRQKQQRIRNILLRIALPIGGILVFLGAAVFLPYLRVANITTEGTSTVPDELVRGIAEEMLKGTFGGMVPRSNILFVRPESIANRLLETYPDIASAHVSYILQIPPELHITIEERTHVGIFCAVENEEYNNEACFYIDGNGVLFAEAPNLRGHVVTRFITKQGRRFSLGDEAISADDMHVLDAMVRIIEEKTLIRVEEVRIDASYEGERVFHTNEGWDIIFEAGEDSTRGLENLFLVLEEHITNHDNLSYIDIRLPQKVFFKYNDK